MSIDNKLFLGCSVVIIVLLLILIGIEALGGANDDENLKSLENSLQLLNRRLDTMSNDTCYTADGMVKLKTFTGYLQGKIKKGEIKNTDDLLKFLLLILEAMTDE